MSVILTLPNFKIIIDTVESKEDDNSEPFYQEHKLVNHAHA